LRDKTFRALGATAVLLGIIIAALAQAGPGDPTAIEISAPDDHTTTSTQPTTSEALAEPFEYRIGLLSGVSTQNYWQYLGEEPTAWNAYVLGPTKPALYSIEAQTSSLVPEAITSAQDPLEGADGWSVSLKLRDDLTWSDGTPITAIDVAFTFATVRSLQLGGGWADAFPLTVSEVVALSDTDVRIDFTERPTLSVWPYGLGLAPIMPEHAWGEAVTTATDAAALYALSGETDVSGGPLTLLEVGELEIRAELTGGDEPVSVLYRVYEDEAAAVAGLANSEIDTILSPKGLSPTSVQTLAASDGVTVLSSPANAVRYLGFNLERDPMSSEPFRDALGLLLDRESNAADLVPGASAAYTVLSPANNVWFDDGAAAKIVATSSGLLEQRLATAVEILTSVGYLWETAPTTAAGVLVAGSGLTVAGQSPAPLTILTSGDEYDPTRPDYALEIEEVLDALGFDARTVITDFDTVVDLAFETGDDGTRGYDMYLLGWTLGNPALPGYYSPLFSADGSANSTGYSAAEFEAFLESYEASTSVEEARVALWAMETVVADDKPYLVLYHPEIVEAYRSDRIGFGRSEVLGGVQQSLGGLDDLIPSA
jgi:peptide/nickel transport system substrate-binding protein